MSAEQAITLKEVQLRLGVPQHVLIHLCEKGVIEPDLAQTSGRGKRREFSERNLFEFAVALALRRFELPVATTALVVRVLRSFLRSVGKAVPGLELPQALGDAGLDLELRFYDGDLLVLCAEGKGLRKPLMLGAKVGAALHGSTSRPRIERLSALPEDFEACLDVQLSEVWRRLRRWAHFDRDTAGVRGQTTPGPARESYA